MTYEIIVKATLWVELIFFNAKKYLGVVNVFVAKKKLNYIGIDLMWHGQLGKYKDNLNDR